MFTEQDLSGVAIQVAGDLVRQPQLAAQPQRHGHDVGTQAPRRRGEVGLQQPLEFQQRLLVETHEIELRDADASFAQAIRHRVRGKGGIVFLAREPFFLRGGDDASVLDQARRRIVVEGRDTEDPGGHSCQSVVHASLFWVPGSCSCSRVRLKPNTTYGGESRSGGVSAFRRTEPGTPENRTERRTEPEPEPEPEQRSENPAG